MEQQTGRRRQLDDFNFSKVKENVVGLLFVTTIMGVVGFIVGTRELLDALDVQHRKDVRELRDAINHHEFQLEQIEEFIDDGPRFTLTMGQELRKDCSVLENTIEYWKFKISENAQGLKEVRAECRNLISKTWENLNRDHN